MDLGLFLIACGAQWYFCYSVFFLLLSVAGKGRGYAIIGVRKETNAKYSG